jgi:hypothetical protein
MEILSKLLDIILYIIPAAGVVAVVYVLLKQYFEHQQKTQEQDWRAKRDRNYLPMQVQAYERLILFLERIHPERLVFRINKPGMSARFLQSEIFKIVREEFDHNLTQQLYVSTPAWNMVKQAKDETLNILKVAAERVDKEADSLQFSGVILETVEQLNKLPNEIAIDALKAEYRKKVGE